VEDREALAAELEAVWRGMFDGDDPGDLPDDLERLRAWFGPEATLASIRKRLRSLPRVEVSKALSCGDPPLVLRFGGRVVIMVEGRWALQRLGDAGAGEIDLSATEVVQRYRDWAHTPIASAVAEWEGNAPPTRAPSLGLMAIVLVAGATDRARALRLNSALPEEAGAELKELVRGFTARIGRRSNFQEDVWRYPLSMATKRFVGLLREGGEVWVSSDLVDATIAELASELEPPKRELAPDEAFDAVAQLVVECERSGLFDGSLLPPLSRRWSEEMLRRLRRDLGQPE